MKNHTTDAADVPPCCVVSSRRPPVCGWLCVPMLMLSIEFLQPLHALEANPAATAVPSSWTLAGGGPVDPRASGAAPAISNTGNFALRMFVFLNWPALPGMRGVPDPSGRLGQSAPTVWETFKNASEIYLPNGQVPSTWPAMSELPAGVVAPSLQQLQERFGVTDSPWIHYLAEDIMIDGNRICDANAVQIRYEVRCNRDNFGYVVSNPSGYPLYTLEGQEQALADPRFQFLFPSTSVEVKASWRILGPNDDDSRYWTAFGAYRDPVQGKVLFAKIGLTAFHFASNLSPGGVWLTYEQADNSTSTFLFLFLRQGKPVGPNATVNPAAAPYNQALRAGTAGTKWQYYNIIGWQASETTSTGDPFILTNSNIETYFEQSSSCMSCHAMANIGPRGGAPGTQRLDFWIYPNGGITGRVGLIDFQAIAKKAFPNIVFKQMDSVWSLKEAQSTQAAAP